MKLHPLLMTLVCSNLAVMTPAAPLGTAFSYQGRLLEAGAGANGLFDMTFTIFNAATGGVQISNSDEIAPVAVSNGVFTVALDFGNGPFDGNPRWVEISVTRYGTDQPVVVLNPRQLVQPVPYAMYAGTAGTLSMPVPDSLLSSNVARLDANQAFTGLLSFNAVSGAPFAVGNSGRVTNLNADLLDGLDSTAFWKLGGNNGISDSSFMGTTDNKTLEFKVNNSRAFRLQPGSNSPSLLAGFPGNRIPAVVNGASILGGGAGFAGFDYTNVVQADFSSVAGGVGNQIFGPYCSIAGGIGNVISSNASGCSIGGGAFNNNQGEACIIAGGRFETIQTNTENATLSGGERNLIHSGAHHTTISGGYANSIDQVAYSSTIGGGELNQIGVFALYSTIGGGTRNSIAGNARDSIIAGGEANSIGTNGGISTISGGDNNSINGGASSIGGGSGSAVDGEFCHIAGGAGNNIQRQSYYTSLVEGTTM